MSWLAWNHRLQISPDNVIMSGMAWNHTLDKSIEQNACSTTLFIPWILHHRSFFFHWNSIRNSQPVQPLFCWVSLKRSTSFSSVSWDMSCWLSLVIFLLKPNWKVSSSNDATIPSLTTKFHKIAEKNSKPKSETIIGCENSRSENQLYEQKNRSEY